MHQISQHKPRVANSSLYCSECAQSNNRSKQTFALYNHCKHVMMTFHIITEAVNRLQYNSAWFTQRNTHRGLWNGKLHSLSLWQIFWAGSFSEASLSVGEMFNNNHHIYSKWSKCWNSKFCGEKLFKRCVAVMLRSLNWGISYRLNKFHSHDTTLYPMY